MIDWDAPEAPSLELKRDVQISTIAEAVALLDQWQAAEAECWQKYLLLHREFCRMKLRAENAETLAANFEALLEYRDKL